MQNSHVNYTDDDKLEFWKVLFVYFFYDRFMGNSWAKCKIEGELLARPSGIRELLFDKVCTVYQGKAIRIMLLIRHKIKEKVEH